METFADETQGPRSETLPRPPRNRVTEGPPVVSDCGRGGAKLGKTEGELNRRTLFSLSPKIGGRFTCLSYALGNGPCVCPIQTQPAAVRLPSRRQDRRHRSRGRRKLQVSKRRRTKTCPFFR